MPFEHPVLSALLPVVLLIAVGYGAGRARWIRPESVRDLSNLVFLVLSQALLFRTMSSTHLERLDLRPVWLYFGVAIAMFLALTALGGRSSRAAVLALATIYSNAVMIGVPLVGLAWGQEGLVLLFTLISLHALVLLTFATVVIELLVAHETSQGSGAQARHPVATIWSAVRTSVIHPVPLPILAGLAFAQTGWTLPAVVDRPLVLMGQAFGPVALMLVGISLAQTAIGPQLVRALGIAALKTLVFPIAIGLAGWAVGLRGMGLGVMVTAAALPVGANVFLFAQRYGKAEDLVTASLAVSTLMALLSVSLVMALMPWLPA